MLALCLRFLRRNALRIGVVLGTFALVASFIFVQQMREAFAEQDYQSARTQVLAAQARAAELGLDTAEYSDLQRQELTTAAEAPPSAAAPFNEERIAFFSRAATQESDIKEQLETRMQKLLAETHDSAQASVRQLSLNLGRARQLGVDEQLLDGFTGIPVKAQLEVNEATTVRAFRAVSTELKAPLSKVSLIIADQETTNQLVGEYAAQAAAKDHGDAGLARAGASAALTQVRADLQTARIFQMDVAIVDLHVQKLATQLSSATTVAQLEQINGGLSVEDKVLQTAMSQSLPEKALTISLKEQVIRAYSHGQQVFWTYVTTGRPGLETDPGSFKVYWKISPWTMHSPWPKGSPYWYPDSKVRMVMWFNGGGGNPHPPLRSRDGPRNHVSPSHPPRRGQRTHCCGDHPSHNKVLV